MSLPSRVKFFKDGKEIADLFTNCGWFCDEETVVDGIKDTIKRENFTEDWEEVEAYGYNFNRENFESYVPPKPKPIKPVTEVTLPKINKMFPKLVAEDIVSFQPMNTDCGYSFNIRTETNTENLRMYILILDWVDIGHALNSMAHAGCMIPEHWSKDDPIIQEWYDNSFRKVTCKVSEKQFEKAKEYGEWFVVTEKQFDDKEVVLVFKPRREWGKFFKFLPLYK